MYIHEPIILHFETSTDLCSVALSLGEHLLSSNQCCEERNHVEKLTVFADNLLYNHNFSPSQLDAIAVSHGPGSYTGLRIGLSAAKGLCYGADIPLIAVPTLYSMCLGFLETNVIDENALLCPMIDARRMEVYTALYDNKGKQLKDTSAQIINEDSFNEWFNERKIYFFGNGALKCKSVISNQNAIFDETFKQSASYMIKPALNSYKNAQFEDIAYFEPMYLKDFIAGAK